MQFLRVVVKIALVLDTVVDCGQIEAIMYIYLSTLGVCGTLFPFAQDFVPLGFNRARF